MDSKDIKTVIRNGQVIITGYPEKTNNSPWISVEEQLPSIDEEVVVLCDIFNNGVLKVNFGHIVDKTIAKDYNGWNIPNVVFWQPFNDPRIEKYITEKAKQQTI